MLKAATTFCLSLTHSAISCEFVCIFSRYYRRYHQQSFNLSKPAPFACMESISICVCIYACVYMKAWMEGEIGGENRGKGKIFVVGWLLSREKRLFSALLASRWVVATASARNSQMCQPEFNLEGGTNPTKERKNPGIVRKIASVALSEEKRGKYFFVGHCFQLVRLRAKWILTQKIPFTF